MRRVANMQQVQNPPRCERVEDLGPALEKWLSKSEHEMFNDRNGRPCQLYIFSFDLILFFSVFVSELLSCYLFFIPFSKKSFDSVSSIGCFFVYLISFVNIVFFNSFFFLFHLLLCLLDSLFLISFLILFFHRKIIL